MPITKLIACLLEDAELRQELGRDIRPVMARYGVVSPDDVRSLVSMDRDRIIERVKAEMAGFQFSAGEFDVPSSEWISDNGGQLAYVGPKPAIYRVRPREVKRANPNGPFTFDIFGKSFAPGVDAVVQLLEANGTPMFQPGKFPIFVRFGTFRASGIHVEVPGQISSQIPVGKYRVQVINYPGTQHEYTLTDSGELRIQ
jgi:hypothetical protein